MAKDDELRPGDRVEWNSHGGTAEGTVVERITEPTDVGGHEAKPTEDDPQYLVETDDGTRAAHKPSALTKKG